MGSLFLVVDNCCLIIKEWQELQAAMDELPEAIYKTWELLHQGKKKPKGNDYTKEELHDY